MFGWVIFRSTDFQQLQYYSSALFHMNAQGKPYLEVTADIYLALALGASLALLPRLPGYGKWSLAYMHSPRRSSYEALAFSALGLLALAKVVGNSYTPFLYFKLN